MLVISKEWFAFRWCRMHEIQNRMMVSGQLFLKGTGRLPDEVRRCMAVISRGGRALGIAAAVCLDPLSQDVAAVLLGRPPVTAIIA